MHPLVKLAHGFTVDFFNGHNVSACTRIMAPDYSLRLGDFLIDGRDAQYMPALQQQFEQFPGIVMTAHKVVCNGDRIALHVTEHGASGGVGGRVAAWTAIALYRWNGTQLSSCLAQEDYASRRRQLKSGVADPIDPPMAAPWDIAPSEPNHVAEQQVTEWLQTSAWMTTPQVVVDDEHRPGVDALVFEVETTELWELFSAGRDVAFHTRQTGRYISGFSDINNQPNALNQPSTSANYVLYSAGIVTVDGNTITSGRVVRDRLGLQSQLRDQLLLT
jgi:SnoaL-like domain